MPNPLTLQPLRVYVSEYHVKGVRFMDFVTVRELLLNQVEIVGRLGVAL